MCGRYSVGDEPIKIKVGLAERTFHFPVRYNAAPTQFLPVILLENDELVFHAMKWGITRPKGLLINARQDNLLKFHGKMVKERRCLIPAIGFYEWQTRGGSKQPWRFLMKDAQPFCFAGIWTQRISDAHRDMEIDIHDEPPPGCVTEEFAIITVAPNDLVRPVHDRMPAIVNTGRYAEWLQIPKRFGLPMPRAFGTCHPRVDHSEIDFMSALFPVPAEYMTSYPCDPIVNKAGNETNLCWRRVVTKSSVETGRLF